MHTPIVFDMITGGPSGSSSAFLLVPHGTANPSNASTAAATSDAITNVFGALQPISMTNGSTPNYTNASPFALLTGSQVSAIYAYCS